MRYGIARPPEHDGGMDEAELVQAALEDDTAFEWLYYHYRDRVYGYLRTRTASDEDAADLTQQVFLRVLDALPQYQAERGPFAAWLFTIARNMATDLQRRRRTTIAWDLVPPSLQPMMGESPETRVMQQEDRAHLASLIRSLDLSKREVLALRFVARLNIVEIAAIIGKREDATRKYLTRTLQSLKEQYRDARS